MLKIGFAFPVSTFCCAENESRKEMYLNYKPIQILDFSICNSESGSKKL